MSQSSSSIAPQAEEDHPFLEPTPPKHQISESPSKVRMGKYKLKHSNTLKISNITKEYLQQLQKVLAECGAIRSLDTRRLVDK